MGCMHRVATKLAAKSSPQDCVIIIMFIIIIFMEPLRDTASSTVIMHIRLKDYLFQPKLLIMDGLR